MTKSTKVDVKGVLSRTKREWYTSCDLREAHEKGDPDVRRLLWKAQRCPSVKSAVPVIWCHSLILEVKERLFTTRLGCAPTPTAASISRYAMAMSTLTSPSTTGLLTVPGYAQALRETRRPESATGLLLPPKLIGKAEAVVGDEEGPSTGSLRRAKESHSGV